MPEAADRRCEGIADFAARRALVAQVVLFTSGFTEEFIAQHQDDDRDGDLHELGEPQEAIYDGANTYVRVGGNWTGFFLGDPGGPRGVNDPLWPLDALFGARDAAEIGAESVRGVSAADITPPGSGEVVSPRDAYSEAGGLGLHPRRRRPRRREPRAVRRKRTSVSRTGTGATVRDPVANGATGY